MTGDPRRLVGPTRRPGGTAPHNGSTVQSDDRRLSNTSRFGVLQWAAAKRREAGRKIAPASRRSASSTTPSRRTATASFSIAGSVGPPDRPGHSALGLSRGPAGRPANIEALAIFRPNFFSSTRFSRISGTRPPKAWASTPPTCSATSNPTTSQARWTHRHAEAGTHFVDHRGGSALGEGKQGLIDVGH